MVCLHCDGKCEMLAAFGKDAASAASVPIAPYICAWCGSLMLLLRGRQLLPMHPEALAVMKQNREMWDLVQRKQTEIRALPNRRKVLR